MVLPNSRWISRVLRYLGNPRKAIRFRLQGCYLLWRAFPDPSTTRSLCNFLGNSQLPLRPPRPRTYNACGLAYARFGLFPVRSPLLGESRLCFLFLRLLRWFSSPRWLLTAYEFSGGCVGITPRRFPDSEISGSMPVSDSPELIAAVHVLHRLPAPRHPPCALSSLTVSLRRTPNDRNRSSVTERRAARCIYLTCDALPFRLIGCLRFSCQRTGLARPPGRQAQPDRRTARLGRRCVGRGSVELIGFEPTTLGLQSRCSPD